MRWMLKMLNIADPCADMIAASFDSSSFRIPKTVRCPFDPVLAHARWAIVIDHRDTDRDPRREAKPNDEALLAD